MTGKADRPVAHASRDIADLSIAVIGGLSLAITVLFLCTVPLSGNIAGTRDFISYWATGRQLVRHANPYDRQAIFRAEHSAGFTPNAVLLMRNPPWSLPLAYPMGFLGLRLAAILWSLLLFACLLVSIWLIREMHDLPPNHMHWLGLSFPPALLCLFMGQTALFSLLGLVLFMRYEHRRPFAAGAALWLCALKPHLFVPFAAALLLWIVMARRYRILAGTASAMAVSLVAAWWMDPAAWAEYLAMMRAPFIEQEFVPCLADAIRFWVRPQAVWIQFLPCVFGCVWAIFYYWRRRGQWEWRQNGGVLMLVSILVAPYGYVYDQGLAIPALLYSAYSTRSRTLLLVLVAAVVALDVQFAFANVISPWYMWTAPAWLAWYLAARATAGKQAAKVFSAIA